MRKENIKGVYDGVIREILYYSEKTGDGRWVIPVEVDWDYTITKCSSWETGEMSLNEKAFEVMRRWGKDYNVGWILNSMRDDKLMKEPLEILEKEGINLYGLRRNPLQLDGYATNEVTKSFAVFCIDDRNLGTPVEWMEGCDRPHVDWVKADVIMSPILEYIANKINEKNS